jgi:mono/diheme cytochrome c family protein
MRLPRKTLALMFGAAMPATAASQEVGDAGEGFRYASEVCSECHAVRRDELASPLPQAPRFEDVANTPGMTGIALIAWFQTSHPTMPDIVMKDEEMRNVVQYILSLKND